ncbi:MAG: FHA domain-containing protein [Desulfobacterales bacterium]|nr:FHA domain-containing protein [Desulfobacterales bacterium]
MIQPSSIIVQLVHIHGPMKGEIQEFSGNEIFIGRHPSCDLQFPTDLVVISRKHAHIIREGNRFKLVDSSTNGTFVNGTKIDESWLKDGDVIFFTEGGPKVSFLTRQGETVQAVSTPPSSAHPLPVVQPPQSPPPPFQPQPLQESVPISQSVTQSPPVRHPQSAHPPQHQAAPQPEIRVEPVRAPLVIQYGVVLKSFNELPITLGSSPDCDLPLEHPSLAEQHAQIFFSQGSYRIKDLTGQNLILINNQSIMSPATLTPGDKVYLTTDGPAFQFMEGGRMAEINISRQDAIKGLENPDPQKDKEEITKKKTGSFFKKIFG